MLPSTFLRAKPVRTLSVLLTMFMFSGCGGSGNQTPDQSAAFLQGTTQADSAYYLQQMQQSWSDRKTNWQLLAIQALLREGQTQQASELLNQLPVDLNETQFREQSLLAAEVRLAQHYFQDAQSLLDQLDPSRFNRYQQSRYWQAQIDASQGQPSLPLLRALIARQTLLSQPKQQQQNIDATWQALSAMTRDQANALVINADENTLQGWLDLQRLWLDNRHDPDALKAAVKDWQIRYPQNPGARMLPAALADKAEAPQLPSASAIKIALLLPLNGQAALFGRTIQQGFEAAKNENLLASGSTSTDADTPAHDPASDAQTSTPDTVRPSPAPSQAPPLADLKVYDTTTSPINQLLDQVQQEGATIIVGPLLKEDVEQVINSNTALNVLALNQPENIVNRNNICYFALSPEDEARDAARHLHNQGKRHPLLLIPYGKLGDRVSTAFASEWSTLGGGTTLQQRFGSVAELKSSVSNGISLAGVPVTPAPVDQGGSSDNSSGSVDAVWILATPEQMAYIKPMITLRNGSHSDVALYTSSRSAPGNAGPDFRLEMEGLQYSEIPMLAGSNPQLMQQALAAVHDDYSLARLYAMGADAWSLVNHFTALRQTAGLTISGNTGALTATSDCVINRNLSWLQYQNGQIIAAE
ncbi:penicillin-binding protein activator [Enterobacteriaceae bacterium ESL0689]|nr:penicillin-binding protein activator [Enterobacteriaceae bacterium ESL0689]